MRKLITLMALVAITFSYSATAQVWVRKSTLANHEFITGPTPAFTTTNSYSLGNNSGVPSYPAGTGYLSSAASGSGNRGTMITNMTTIDERQDTVYYEFDWKPNTLDGVSDSTGTGGVYPAGYGICMVRDNSNNIIFGLWYERWSHLASSPYNSATGVSTTIGRLGDIHLMNISTDQYNPMPAALVAYPNGTGTSNYYTDVKNPFAMQDLSKSTTYKVTLCDSINSFTDLGVNFKMFNWYHVKAAIDFKNKKIISFKITQKDKSYITRSFTNLPFVNSEATNVSRFELGSPRPQVESGSRPNSNYAQFIDNIDIYTMKEAQADTVRVKYKDFDTHAELKPSRSTLVEIGKTYKVIASDTVLIKIGNVRYPYYSASVDSVVSSAGGAEINLYFKQAQPKNTTVELTAPASGNVHSDVNISFIVKDQDNNFVTKGNVLVYVNDIAKNSIEVNSLGAGTLTFPNLLSPEAKIKAEYIGDSISYNTGMSSSATISINPSTSTVKPYPVYFDLCDQPEIIAREWVRATTSNSSRPFSWAIPADSIAGIVLGGGTSTDPAMYKITYSLLDGSAAHTTENTYNRGDNIQFNMGSGGRPTWVKFKTPWLNAGSYNIYISTRVNTASQLDMTSVTVDDKETYYPNHEMYGRWFLSWNGSNTKRRWNSVANSGSMGMTYIGSANISGSGTHELKITVNPTVAMTTVTPLDMLQFIPVDMDSLTINQTAAASIAKDYFPMFDWCGYANSATGSTHNSFGSLAELPLAYQDSDRTNWGQKYDYTINDTHLMKKTISGEEKVANYVTIYRAEDKWTRVAEGAVTGYDANNINLPTSFTAKLYAGNYYYEAINLLQIMFDGTREYRFLMNTGTFSVGPGTAVSTTNSSKIKVFGSNNKLTVLGIKAGASVLVTDITGRLVVNEIVKSDVFTKALPKGMYVVKVISGETLHSKILIK